MESPPLNIKKEINEDIFGGDVDVLKNINHNGDEIIEKKKKRVKIKGCRKSSLNDLMEYVNDDAYTPLCKSEDCKKGAFRHQGTIEPSFYMWPMFQQLHEEYSKMISKG